MRRGSPNYRDGVFHNLEPVIGLAWTSRRTGWSSSTFSPAFGQPPAAAIPMDSAAPGAGAEPLAVTWLGHATALLEIDGYRLLTDPVWSQRCSPSSTPARSGCTRRRWPWKRCRRWTPW